MGLFDDLTPGGAGNAGSFADLIPKPKPRGLLGFANDTVISAANQIAGGVGSIANAIVPGNRLSQFIDEDIVKAGEDKQSDIVKQSRARFQAELENASGGWDEAAAVGRYVADNPLQVLAQAAGALALVGLPMKGIGALSKAAGLGAKATTAVESGAGAVLGGLMSGGDAAGTAYELVQKTPLDTLMLSPQAQELSSAGLDEKAIRDELGTRAARAAMPIPTLIGAGSGLIGAERILAGGKPLAGGALARGAQTALVEGAGEFADEAATQYFGQKGAAAYNPTIDPTKGVVGAGLLGMALGAPTGGVVGALSPGRDQVPPNLPEPDPVAKVLDAGNIDEAIKAATEATTTPALAWNQRWEPEGGFAGQAPLYVFPDGSAATRDEAADLLAGAAAQRNIDAWVARSPRPMPQGEAEALAAAAQERTGKAMSTLPLPDGKGWTVVPSAWVSHPSVAAYIEQASAAVDVETARQARIAEVAAAPVDRAPRTGSPEGIPVDLSAPNAVEQFVESQRRVNTPAARAFVQEFRAGRITSQDILDLIMPAKAEPSPDERLAAAAAQAPKAAPTDLVTIDGMPYGTKVGAMARAKKEGGSIVRVDGGWVVRPGPQSGNGESAPTQGGLQVGMGAANAVGSRGQSEPGSDEPLRGLDVPSQRVMLSGVSNRIEDDEVLRRVVERIPVNVVNMLFGEQGPTEDLGHDRAVLKNALAAFDQNPVAPNVDVAANAIVSAVASVTAEAGAPLTDSLPAATESRAAVDAVEVPNSGEVLPPARLGAEEAAGLGAGNLVLRAEDGRSAPRTLDNRQVSTPTSSDELGPPSVASEDGPPTVRTNSAPQATVSTPNAVKAKPLKRSQKPAADPNAPQLLRKATNPERMSERLREVAFRKLPEQVGTENVYLQDGALGAGFYRVLKGWKAEAPKPTAPPAPLYASRPVTNAADIMAWAALQGFKSTLPADDLHVTVAYSREPVAGDAVPSDAPTLTIRGGKRTVEPLGDEGAVVLKFTSPDMQARWKQYRDAGASWDYDSYTPHVTITYDGKGVDLAKVEPYTGPIMLGAEKQEALNVDKADEAPAAAPEASAAPAPATRKSLQESRADAALDKEVLDNGERMTRRQWVERKVAEGLTTRVTQEDRIKPMSRMQFFRANNEEQRAHERRIKEGGKKDVFWIGDYEVTKSEHDYAQRLTQQPPADAPAAGAPAPQVEPVATHKDPGEPAEPVTAAVVEEAIATAAENRDRPRSAIKADALRLIDEAIAKAPAKGEKKITIRVPGDGVFSIVNNVDRLKEFRRQVELSPGFKDKQPRPPIGKANESANYGPDQLAREMLEDGEPLNAIEALEAAGKTMMFGNASGDRPTPYTNGEPVEIAGIGDLFVGRGWSTKKGSTSWWSVIHKPSGFALGSTASNKSEAIAEAKKLLAQPEKRAKMEEIVASGKSADGKPFKPQDELRAEFMAWAEKHQQATFDAADATVARAKAMREKDEALDAFYESIMGDGLKRPSRADWTPNAVEELLNAAEKQGKAEEALKFAREVVNSYNEATVEKWATAYARRTQPTDTGWQTGFQAPGGYRRIRRDVTLTDGTTYRAELDERAGAYVTGMVQKWSTDNGTPKTVQTYSNDMDARRKADGFLDGLTSAAKPAQASPVKAPAPAPDAPVSSREGQMRLANRGSSIAALKLLNEQLRKIAPSEAWADKNIEDAADLDALQDQISTALVEAQRAPVAVNPLRAELDEMSGAELRAIMDRMGLAGARMTQSERIEALLAEDEGAVRAAMTPADDAAAPQLTEEQARKQFEWRDMGQSGGTKTHRLFFYLKPEDKGTGRAMGRGYVELYDGSSGWRVDGEGESYKALADAKKAAIEAAIPVLREQGWIAPDAADPKAEEKQAEESDTDAIDERIAAAEAAGVTLSEADKDAIRAALTRADDLRTKADRIAGRASDPMRKGNAFPMGVGFTRMTKRAEQRIDASVRRAGEAVEVFKRANQAEQYAEALLAGKGTEADTIRKAAKKVETQRLLVRKLIDWKKGDKIGGFTVEKINKDRDGYPATFTISGEGIVKGVTDKVSAVREFFDGDKDAFRALVDEERGPQQAAVLAAPASSPLADAKAAMGAIYDGTASVEEFRAAFASVRDNEAGVRADLAKMTKDELIRTFGIMREAKKDELIDIAYESLVSAFALDKSYGPNNYLMTTGGYAQYKKLKAEALSELVAGQTADDLAAYAAEVAKSREERAARRGELKASIENPQTLDDFRRFMTFHTRDGKTYDQARMMLTPEQRAAYDDLSATESRGRRKTSTDATRTQVRVAGQTVDGEIIATKHTKKGTDLYVVRLAERVSREDYETLNAGAKRIGGYYSSFRGAGAVPGFQFSTREQAQAFVTLAQGDNSAAVEAAKERRDAFQDDRSQSAVERLSEMADRLEDRADESLGRERKTNTQRRAGQAASAEASAQADKAMARTMRNIAGAIEAGTAKFLDRVRQKAQVEMLQNFVRSARDEELRAKYPSYADQERQKGAPPTAETADFASFPAFTAYRSDLASLARQLVDVDGTKLLGQRLMKLADDTSEAYNEFARANVLEVAKFFSRGDRLATFESRGQAEESLRRSGLTGKAVVLAVKRGENRIVLSPSEAIKRGIWKGDGDKRITLDPELGADLVEKIGRANRRGAKVSVPWQFETAYDRRKSLARMGIENAPEFRAALREFIGLREQAAAPDKVKQMERAMIGRRNDGLDFFPTPEETADQMVAAADVQEGQRVLEPSAGMGHIAERIRAAGVEPLVAELSSDRRDLLEAKGFDVVGRDFLDITDGGYDRILMNPPFSDGRDIEHVRHAYSLLKPGGRLVALMGESAFTNQNKRATEFREWLESVGGTDEKLAEGTFNDPSLPVNTGANARMVVIERAAADGGTALDSRAYPLGTATGRVFDWFARFGDKPGDGQQGMRDATSTMNVDVGIRAMSDDTLAPGTIAQFNLDDRTIRFNPSFKLTRAEWAQAMAEELMHAVDAISGNRTVSASSARLLPGGDIASEVQDVYASGRGLADFVSYPLDPALGFSAQRVAAELFARLAVLYHGDQALMQRSLPVAYEAYHDLFGTTLLGADSRVLRDVRADPRQDAAGSGDERQRTDAAGRDERRDQGRTPDQGLDALRERAARIFDGDPAGGVVFSRAPGARGRVSVRDARAVVDALRTAFPKAPQIRVLEKVNQAPRALLEDIRAAGAEFDVEAAFHRGEIYVFPGNVENLERLKFVVTKHEIRHAGFRGLLGDGMDRTMLALYEANASVRKAADAKIVARLAGSRAEAVDEALADMTAQDIAAMTGARPLLAKLRLALRRFAARLRAMGWTAVADAITPSGWTDADVVALVLKAESMALRGESDGTRFSRPPVDETDEPRYSRSISAAMAEGLNNVRDVSLPAGYKVADLLDSHGKISAWDKTVGTPFNLAKRFPGTFGRVYDRVQDFLGDVSHYATEAADLAPSILPKLEHLRDIGKSPLSADDTKAISAPIFEGTLTWTRDKAGKPVSMEVAEAAAERMTVDQKAAELLQARRIDPKVLRMWQGMEVDQYEAAITTRYASEMLRPGVVWTDAELRSMFKLSRAQIKLYRQFRAAVDKSLDALAISEMVRMGGADVADIARAVESMDVTEARNVIADRLRDVAETAPDRAKGLEKTANMVADLGTRVADLKERGYAPLTRFGNYTLDVVNDGERVYFGMFESQREANRMQRKMREQFPKATIRQGTQDTESFKLFAGVSPETLEVFGEILGLDSTGDSAKDQAFQTFLKRARSTRSATKRLIHRKGIDGFSEDAGRVLAGFLTSNARRTSGNMHLKDILDAVEDIPQGQGELKGYAAKMVEYVQNPVEEAAALRGVLFAQYLGGSVASALVNMSQPIMVSVPYLSQFGGAKQAAAAMTRAMKDMASGAKLEPALADALKAAEEDGVVAPQEIHQLQAQARGQAALRSGDGTKAGNAAAMASNALSKVSLAWGKLFGFAELVNRRSTYIAAYRVARAQGMPNPDAFARKAVNETQFVYNRGNRPPWARGAVGATLFTFKTYSVSYVELLTRMAKSGPEGRRAALLAVAVLLLMSGADGLPFMEDAEDVLDAFMQRIMGRNWSTKQKRNELLAEVLGKDVGAFLQNGVSGLPGVPIDVSGRMGMGNLIPGTGLLRKDSEPGRDMKELLGPVADLAERTGRAAGMVLQGDVGKAALEVAPTAARNVAKGADMLETGMYRDAKGRKVISTDTTEAIAKMAGFQPSSVARVQEATATVQRAIALNKTVEAEIADQWAQGLYEKDADKVAEARQRLRDWNAANEDYPIKITFQQIRKRLQTMNQDKATRMEKTAPKEIRREVRRELAGISG